MPKSTLPRAAYDITIQGFSPRRGDIFEAGIKTVDDTTVVKLAAQTDIEIDSITATYKQGEIMILVKGVEYNFLSDCPVHIM